jgi:hypothetical protein
LKRINNPEEYELLAQEFMAGLLLMVFARKEMIYQFKNVHTTSIKSGFAGSKGSLICRFELQKTSYIFVCCHYEQTNNFEDQRVQSIKNLENLKLWVVDEEHEFKEHNIKVIFGDLDFRVDQDYKQVIDSLKEIETDEDRREFVQDYLAYDQLLKEQTKHFWLHEYLEMPISFMPTYRVYVGNNYSNEDHIAPSWCERILYKNSIDPLYTLVPLEYESRDIYESDHKPVVAFFEASSSNNKDR